MRSLLALLAKTKVNIISIKFKWGFFSVKNTKNTRKQKKLSDKRKTIGNIMMS